MDWERHFEGVFFKIFEKILILSEKQQEPPVQKKYKWLVEISIMMCYNYKNLLNCNQITNISR